MYKYTIQHDTPSGKQSGLIDRQAPAYSTDIAAAWLVVENLREQGAHIIPIVGTANECSISTIASRERQYDDFHAEADTMPLAICLAALKAVGYEVQSA